VLLTQGQGLGVEWLAVVGGTARAGPVGGREALRLVAEALEQLPDRAGAEVQGTGDFRGGLAAFCPALDEAAQGQREWRRHGNPRRKGSGIRLAYSLDAPRQNLCVGISGVTYCRVTGA
jgi:hypothetical protein